MIPLGIEKGYILEGCQSSEYHPTGDTSALLLALDRQRSTVVCDRSAKLLLRLLLDEETAQLIDARGWRWKHLHGW